MVILFIKTTLSCRRLIVKLHPDINYSFNYFITVVGGSRYLFIYYFFFENMHSIVKF